MTELDVGDVCVVKSDEGFYLTKEGAWSIKQRDAHRFDDWEDFAMPDGTMATRLATGLALHRAEFVAAAYPQGARAVRLRRKP